MEFDCDNEKTYTYPAKHCSSCKHCDDVFYDMRHGPYMWLCNIGGRYDHGCLKYEREDDDATGGD